ncbi:MAG: VWA domain-containing protein [Cytophagales bacterium]|nr:MAG: VWA domain-containing protein [Cytophagales bacterium]TAF61024.1 MAG: VWA domain-containing protein [Cytophagales bacterium]
MSWYNSLGITEIVLVLLFAGFYFLFVRRTFLIAKRMGSPPVSFWPKTILRSVYFLLFLVALLGPSFGEAQRTIKTVGKDILLCIDLSNSMNTNDIQPSRLEKVKYELKKIVDAFSSDRLGIVIFSADAYLQCPLTFDNATTNQLLETIHTSLVPLGGTDFGPPLQMALEKLTATENTTKKQSKIVLLISDGEDFGDEASSIVADFKKEGIRLFTLGVGTETGGNIPTHRGFKKDENGQTIITKLNSQDLRNLAEQASGRYFEISNNRNDTESLIKAINNIQGELRDAKRVDVTANKYTYFLAAALVLFIADLVFTVRLIKI